MSASRLVIELSSAAAFWEICLDFLNSQSEHILKFRPSDWLRARRSLILISNLNSKYCFLSVSSCKPTLSCTHLQRTLPWIFYFTKYKPTRRMDEKLSEILKDFWQWRLNESPELGTMVGDHSRDDKLDDLSLANYDKRLVSILFFYLQRFLYFPLSFCSFVLA